MARTPGTAPRAPRAPRIAGLVGVILLLLALDRGHLSDPRRWLDGAASHPPAVATARDASDAAAAAFAARRSDVALAGEGSVVKVLADDRRGSRHQRFLLRLASGQTLLVAHNIDLAPRVEGLAVGDTVRFAGEYEWNEKGGVLHWTHRDPRGKHPGGWLEHAGRRYQ